MRFPVSLRRLSLRDLVVREQFLIVMFQVLVRDDVVVTEVFAKACWNFLLIEDKDTVEKCEIGFGGLTLYSSTSGRFSGASK